jgi:hypothetical protein
LLERCRNQRAKWLFGVRLHVGALRSGIGAWTDLRSLVGDEQVAVLEQLHADAGDPEVPMTGPTEDRGRRRTLMRLRASVERFNRRWLAFIEKLDLSELNRLREGYNRYYLLEKECAVGSVRLLPQLFQKLPLVTNAEILTELPLLPVPQIPE